MEVDLEAKIRKVDEAYIERAYSEPWKIINDIIGRKSTKAGQVQGETEEERLSMWFTHFGTLLGSVPDVEDEDEDILTTEKAVSQMKFHLR